MLFNSLDFLVYLSVVFLLYWFVFQKRLIWQNVLVLVASYFFYGWWSWKFMGLSMLSTLLDYTYGFSVAFSNRKKAKFFLRLDIINNLAILGIFKYYNFFDVLEQTFIWVNDNNHHSTHDSLVGSPPVSYREK